ncbi:MAG TPA: tyrosine-type recombinase/integrase [Propionibacteriaceae bacterium]
MGANVIKTCVSLEEGQPWKWVQPTRGNQTSGEVRWARTGCAAVHGGQGWPLFRGTFALDLWRPAIKRAQLSEFTFQSLRHSFVGILVAAGCNVRDVSEWAGHNSVACTLTRYGGLFEDGSEAAVDRLDALLRGSS